MKPRSGFPMAQDSTEFQQEKDSLAYVAAVLEQGKSVFLVEFAERAESLAILVADRHILTANRGIHHASVEIQGDMGAPGRAVDIPRQAILRNLHA